MKNVMKKIVAIAIAAAVVLTCIPVANAQAADTKQKTALAASIDAKAASGGSIWYSGATKNSVSFAWTPVSGAARYALKYDVYVNGAVYANDVIYPTSGTSATISVPENGYVTLSAIYYLATGSSISQSAFDVNPSDYNNRDGVDYLYVTGHSAASAVTGLGYYKYAGGFDKTDNQIKVQYNVSDALYKNIDGFECVLYSKSGSEVEKVYVNKYSTYAVFSKGSLKQMYKVRVRAYSLLSDGVSKVYGDWSSFFYVVPNTTKKGKESDVHVSNFKVKWSKVTGATGYEIYVAKSKKLQTDASKLSFKKAATASKSKTSYTVKKVKGASVSTKKYYYYYTVVPKGKIDGKVRKAAKSYVMWCHTY